MQASYRIERPFRAAGNLCGPRLGAVLLVLAMAACLPAEETNRQFLDALRERGWFDTAIDYLDRAGTDRLTSAEFRTTLPLERGVTLIELARRTHDRTKREALQSEAERHLESFVRDHPKDAHAPRARRQWAHLLLDRGRTLMARSSQAAEATAREALVTEARVMFTRSRQVFEQSEAYYLTTLKTYPKILDPRKEADKIARRNELRNELLGARLALAALTREDGKTNRPESDAYQQRVAEAASQYGKLYEKYRNLLAGLYAHLWEGECYQDLGEWSKAIGCFEQLLDQPADQPAVRALQLKAVARECECLIAQEKFDAAIAKGKEWLERLSSGGEQEKDRLSLKYQLALAHKAKAEAAPPSHPDRRRHVARARRLASEVSRHRGGVRKQARQLLVGLSGGPSNSGPTTFAAPFEEAQEAIEAAKAAKLGLKLARRNDPSHVEALARQLGDHRHRAYEQLRTALRLADRDTPSEDLEKAIYYLAFVNWELGHFYDAAVLGEHLARHHPESPVARQAAKIALASYQRISLDPNNRTPQFETERLNQVAHLITQQWPDPTDADDAYAVLIHLATQKQQWDRALKLVDKMSSERRAVAKLRIGMAIWSRLLRDASAAGQKEAGSQSPRRRKLLDLARATLADALQGFREGNASTTGEVATAALSLAQVDLERGAYQDAVATLEDQQIGPLPLLAAGSAGADRPGFAEETYKAALRAYMSVDPPRSDKLLEIVDALQRGAKKTDDTAARGRLVHLYLGLARQLMQRARDLPASQIAKEGETLSDTLKTVLNRALTHGATDNWSTGLWIAETYADLGDLEASTSSPRAIAGYAKAVDAYDAILKRAKSDPSFAPEGDAVLAVMLRKAECLQRGGQLRQAIDLFATVLGKKPNMLTAQVAAASTYEDRGDHENAKWYAFAWQGGRKEEKTGKKRIWGWAKLAHVTARYKQYRDTFFQARYHLAHCRLKYGLALEEPRRTKYVKLAANDLRITVELYPELHDSAWTDRYDRLLKQIEKALGQPPRGLAGLKK
ncbi:MAG: tetratricopeptide repeat protein [Pirellulales bacterium]